MKQYKIAVHVDGKVVREVDVVTGGSHAVHMRAQPNARYELIEVGSQKPLEMVKAKRVGNQMVIQWDDSDEDFAELVIDDYYALEGQQFGGTLEDGSFWPYTSESGAELSSSSASEGAVQELENLAIGGFDTLEMGLWALALAGVAGGLDGGIFGHGARAATVGDDGNLVDIDAVTRAAALANIGVAAQNDTAAKDLTEGDFANAGVTGVTATNLAAINDVLDTTAVDGAAVDSAPKVQAVVDAYTALLAAADGQDDDDAGATEAQYALLGVTVEGASIALLNSVVDKSVVTAVDRVAELQSLAAAARAVIAAAAGGTAPTQAQLEALGITGITPSNLAAVQQAIANTVDDGTGIDNLKELQALASAAERAAAALTKISVAAQGDTAAKSLMPDDFAAAGVTGVTAANLASINNLLDTAAVDGPAVDTASEVQALVDTVTRQPTLDGDDVIDGGSDNDTLNGGDGNDTVNGGDGNDSVNGGNGNDLVDGGNGDDTVNGGDGDDTVNGGDGNDLVDGGNGNDLVDGGNGDDTVNGGDGDDTVNGGDGNDLVDGGNGNDLVDGGNGDDTVNGGDGDDTVNGGDGNDLVDGGNGNDLVDGGNGDDTVNGGDGDDTVKGGDGNDLVDGGNGNDLVDGGNGDDTVNGGDGDDTVKGGDGNDLVDGGNGNDLVDGGNGDDTLNGGDGNDRIVGGIGSGWVYCGNGDDIAIVLAGNDTVYGGDGNDSVDGGQGNDLVDGGNGNDTVIGGDGNDLVDGGNGNDLVDGGNGDDTVNGGDGNDLVDGGNGNDLVDGGNGDDTVNGGDGNDLVDGGNGNDLVDGGNGDDTVNGGDGNDTVNGGDGNDSVDGGNGNDSVGGGNGNDTVSGGNGDDTVNGGDGNDLVDGGNGNDLVDGGNGDDTVNGGDGNDLVDGGNGNDLVDGGNGDDTVKGGDGNDTVSGGDGNDSVDGGNGNDSVGGGNGDDTVNGGDGNDLVDGGNGNDLVDGGNGDDTVNGGDGNDTVSGGEGNDSVGGGNGIDTVNGGNGDDTVNGGDGNDLVDGGNGNDLVDGGNGDDTVKGGDGNDTVSGGDGNDSVDGGNGSDSVGGGNGNDTVNGGNGDDTVNGGDGNDLVDGGNGNDLVDGGNGDDTINGGDGNDTVSGGNGNDLVDGGNGNDLVGGGNGNDTVSGGNGDDTINGGDGNDLVDGGNGNDLVDGGNGDDTVNGGDGNDTVSGGEGNDSVGGGNGNDTLSGGNGDDTVNGGDDNDLVDGGNGNDLVDGGNGNDSVGGGNGNDSVSGGNGDDTVNGGDGNDLVDGGNGNDLVDGGNGDDTINGGDGNDTVSGGNGDDTVNGGDGNDLVDGGNGNDLVVGGNGDDTVKGGDGNDTVNGGDGNDSVDGGNGNDSVGGGNGNDTVSGGNGDDTVNGGDGNDLVDGNDGNDSVGGGNGNDTVSGGDGDDAVDGGNGNDSVSGGNGDDTVNGGEGNDTLNGIQGKDRLIGGNGDDLFIINGTENLGIVDGGAGNDTVRVLGSLDLTALPSGTITNVEVIDLGAGDAGQSLTLSSENVVDMAGPGGTLVVTGAPTDGLTLTGSSWSLSQELVNGITYERYTASNGVSLLVGGGVPLTAPLPAAPTVSLTTDTGGADKITSIAGLSVTGTESGAIVQYEVDGGGVWTNGYAAPTTGGAHTVAVRQITVAGNTSPATSLTFTLDTTAAAPTVSLTTDTGGADKITFNAGVSVTGTESGATVQYEVNGNDVWTNSYMAPTADGTYTVAVRQIDTAGTTSAESNLTFTLDTTAAAPTVSLITDTGGADKITFNAGVSVTGTESGATVQYEVNGNDVWTNSYMAPTADGPHTVAVRQIDTAGNTSAESSLTFTLDTTAAAPTVSLITDTGGADMITSNAGVSVTGTESGAMVQYEINGADVWTNSYVAPTSDGTYTVAVRQIDTAGTTSAESSLTFTLDTTAAAPTVSLTTDTGGADKITFNAGVSVTGTESGAMVQYEINGDDVWTNSYVAPTSDGTYTVAVRQIDTAGTTSAESSLTFTLDTTAAAPTVSLITDTGGADKITFNAGVSVTGTESGAMVQYEVNGNDVWTNSYMAPTADGTYTVAVRQIDTAGTTSAESNLTFTLDTTAAAPTVSLITDTGGADKITFNAGVSVTGTESGATVQYEVNGNDVWTNSYMAPTADGTYTVAVRQIDTAGNTSAESSLTFTFDTTAAAPTASLITDTGGADMITSNAGVSVTGTESGAMVQYEINGDDVWTNSYVAPTSDGTYTVAVRQIDTAGTTSAESSLTFTLDTTAAAPTVSLTTDTGGADKITFNAGVSVIGTESGATVQYEVNGNDVWTNSYMAPTADGTYTVAVRQIDTAGNTSAESSLTFTFDTTAAAPTASLITDTGGADMITSNAGVSVTGTESGAMVQYEINGDDVWTNSYVAPTTDGTYTVAVRQIDTAGTTSAESSLTFTLDTTAPTVTSFSSTSPNGTYQAGSVINITAIMSESVNAGSTFNVTLDTGATVTVTANASGTQLTGNYTVGNGVSADLTVVSFTRGTVTDLAGNSMTGTTLPASNIATSSNIVITDTQAPSVYVGLSDSALKLGESTDVYFSFSEAVLGFSLADVTAQNGSLSDFRALAPDSWVATFTPTANIEDGSNVVTVANSYTDVAGNLGTAGSSDNYTVDTKAPTATIYLSNYGVQSGGVIQVIIEFSESMDTASVMEHLIAENGVLFESPSEAAWDVDNKSLLLYFTPDSNVEDVTNVIRLTSGYLDASGNAGAAVSSPNYAVDSLWPTVTSFSSTTPNGTYQSGDVINITANMSEAMHAGSSFDVTLNTGETVTLWAGPSGTTFTGNYTVHAIGDWTELTVAGITTGTATDLAGNPLNTSLPESNLASGSDIAIIDTEAPTVIITPYGFSAGNYNPTGASIVFSEPVTDFSIDLLSSEHLELYNLRTDDHITWTINIGYSEVVDDATNVIALAAAADFEDWWGNSVMPATSANFAVDTIAPEATITLDDYALTTGETTKVTIVFSEPVSALSLDDIRVSGSTVVSDFSSMGDNMTWTFNITPWHTWSDTDAVIVMGSLFDVAGNPYGNDGYANYTINAI